MHQRPTCLRKGNHAIVLNTSLYQATFTLNIAGKPMLTLTARETEDLFDILLCNHWAIERMVGTIIASSRADAISTTRNPA